MGKYLEIKNFNFVQQTLCYSVRKTPDLVEQYLYLIEKYKDSGYILERLENLEIKIDSVIERQMQES